MLVGLYRARRILIRLDPGFAIGESSAGPFSGAVTGSKKWGELALVRHPSFQLAVF